MEDFKQYKTQELYDNSKENSFEEIIPTEVIPNVSLPKHHIVPSFYSDTFSVKFLNVVSPTSFFLLLKTKENLFKMFSQNITRYYSNIKNEPLKVVDLPVGSAWAVFYNNDWYRASITKKVDLFYSKQTKLQFEVLLEDYGVTAVVSLKNIFYLEKQFQVDPPFAFHCRLAEVYPTSNMLWNANPWTREAIEAFCEMCRTSVSPSAIFTENIKSEHQYSVILDSSDGRIINEELVIRGFATSPLIVLIQEKLDTKELNDIEATSMPAVRTEEKEKKEKSSLAVVEEENEEIVGAEWDPLGDAFIVSSQTTCLNDECAESILVGFKNRDDETICRFYRNYLRCPEGQMCKWRHVLPRPDGLSGDQVGVFSELERVDFLPRGGDFVQVIVATVYSSDEFYSLLVNPVTQDDGKVICEVPYFKLQRELQSCYKNSRGSMAGPIPAVGELKVVFNSSSSKTLKGFHRVRVLSADVHAESAEYKVLYIDLGFTEVVNEHQLRPFSPQFLWPPPQAIHCYLAHVQPVTDALLPENKTLLADLADSKLLTAYVAEEDSFMDGRLGMVLLDFSGEELFIVNTAFVESLATD